MTDEEGDIFETSVDVDFAVGCFRFFRTSGIWFNGMTDGEGGDVEALVDVDFAVGCFSFFRTSGILLSGEWRVLMK